MDLSNYKTEYGSAFEPAQNTSQVQTTQPQSQYGFSQQQPSAQLQEKPGFINVFFIGPEHFEPYVTKCPHCSVEITTEISFFVGGLAKGCIFILLISFIWFGFICVAFLPCCMKSFKDAKHTCPRCRRTVAIYRRGDTAPHLKNPCCRDRGYSNRLDLIQVQVHSQAARLQHEYMVNQQEPKPGVLLIQRPWVRKEHFLSYLTTCQHCQTQVTTRVSYNDGLQTWFCCYIFCCIFIWFGLFCVPFFPFCMNEYKDIKHTCPNCSKVIAVFERHEMVE